MKINILTAQVFNRISAGEVVEKPASIVKEMVENSIDAGADTITIEIEEGGIKKIVVSDNGCGIDREDLKAAFLPHATSKINSVEDLNSIATLGFRGEALASIASVCHVFMSSRTREEQTGHSISVDGGVFGEIREVSRNEGTTIEVYDLFYNTPVRAKFLRKPKSEESEITHLVQKFMLAHPEVSFCYIIDGKQIYNTTSSELSDIIYTIYGREVYDNILSIDYSEGQLSLKGCVVAPKLSKPNRTYQTLFVNGRYVENYLVSSAIQGVYESFLMKGRFPIYVLNLIIPHDSVDINVHPTKKEVKFENSNQVFAFVRRAVENALAGANHIASLSFEEEKQYDTFTEMQSPYNRNGFGYIPIRNDAPMSDIEGSSYSTRRDNPEFINKPLYTEEEAEVKTEKITKNLPNFEDITITEERPVNNIGGPIFFDQSREKHAAQIMKGTSISTDKMFKSSTKDEMKVFGALFDTYVVIEFADSIFLVDQHAAHERQLFDKLVNRIDDEEIIKQPLLFPYVFSVNNREKELIKDSMDKLSDLGFDIQPNGDNAYSITAIPMVLDGLNLGKFIEDVLSDEEIWVKKASDIVKDKLAQTACKHAVKGGDKLSIDQLAELVDSMKKGVMLCPHGRPTVIEITRKQLEKMFKRIV